MKGKIHLINKQTGYLGNFFKKRGFWEKANRKPIPMTLCGLTKEDFKKGDGLTNPQNCNCELCLQVNDNVEKPDV